MFVIARLDPPPRTVIALLSLFLFIISFFFPFCEFYKIINDVVIWMRSSHATIMTENFSLNSDDSAFMTFMTLGSTTAISLAVIARLDLCTW
jgi:hypothetical protein